MLVFFRIFDLNEFDMIFIIFLESNEMHRILWNAMKCIESNGMQWNQQNTMESNEFYMILCSFTLILMLVWTIGGVPRGLRALHGSPQGPFGSIVENSKIWITSFWGLWERMGNITLVLLMFLRCHFEAQFEQCCKIALSIIHLRGKLLCIFIDFHAFAHQKKSSVFRYESLCVVLNAFLTCENWASHGDFWYFKMHICLFLLHTHADINNSYEAVWRPLGRNYQY